MMWALILGGGLGLLAASGNREAHGQRWLGLAMFAVGCAMVIFAAKHLFGAA